MKQKIKTENFVRKNVFYLSAIIVLVLLVALLIQKPVTTTENNASIEQQIIRELASNPDVKNYANYTAYVKLITEKDLEEFRSQQPAVYGDVPAGSYRIIYQGESDALLVIYDFEKKQILKLFAVQTLVI